MDTTLYRRVSIGYARLAGNQMARRDDVPLYMGWVDLDIIKRVIGFDNQGMMKHRKTSGL